jgi:hypothetical protein
MGWLQHARDTVAEHQFRVVNADTGERMSDEYAYGCQAKAEEDGAIILDAYTASMLCQVHDALNAENQAKFAGLSLLRAVNVGWKLCRK